MDMNDDDYYELRSTVSVGRLVQGLPGVLSHRC